MTRPLAVILLAVILDVSGIGLIMPVLPELLRSVSAPGADISLPYGLLLSLYAFMQFVFAPVLGALSDRYGRRPVLLLSLAGAAVDYLIMAFSPTLSVLVVGRVIAGITAASMAVATAYIADITEESQRAQRYGWLSACFGIGFVAGPALGGLLSDYSARAPFLAAAALNGLNFLLALFVLPESHRRDPTQPRAPLRWRELNPAGAFLRLGAMRTLLPMVAIYFVIYLVGQLPPSIWVLNGEQRLGWDSRAIGLSLAGFGIVHALVQALLTGPATKRLGERGTIVLGLLADGFGYFAMAFITQGWIVFALMPAFAIGGLALPPLQSLISAQVDENRQGELQGTLAALVAVSAIVGPIVITTIYAASLPFWAGAVWLLGPLGYLACAPLLLRRLGSLKRRSDG